MASPLDAFRKNQKTLLAIFGVVLILVFTVGTVLTELFSPGQGGGRAADPVVVRWKNGQVRESELQNQRAVRALLDTFQQDVARLAASRGGQPQGMFIPNSEAHVVESMLLAREAEKQGIVVGNDAVVSYLENQLADGTVQRNEQAAILKQATNGNLKQQQLFAAVRTELLAHQLRLLANGAAFDGGIADTAVTPADSFEYFKRLYRRMEAELMPIQVTDFVDQVTETPSDQEIADLYDEYKDAFPTRFAPTPGFKEPTRAAFQWVKADFPAFLDREVANVPDADIESYYEANKDSYRKIELPSSTEFQFPMRSPEEPEKSPPSESAVAPGDDLAPVEEAGSDEQTPADDEPDSEPSAAERVEAEADSEAAVEATEAGEPAVNESSQHGLSGLLLAQADLTEELAELTNAVETAADGALDASSAEEADTDLTAEPGVTETQATDSPDSSNTSNADTTANTAATTSSGVTYQPLSEVRDSIAQQLARPLAKKAMDEALAKARAEMDNYFGKFVSWQVAEDADRGEQPAPPNLTQLATELGLQSGSIPLSSELEVDQYELGKAYELDFTGGQINRRPFTQMGFSANTSAYQPKQISASDIDSQFLFWMVDQKESYTPTLEEARPKVVRHWKMKKALQLAEKKGAEYVAKLGDTQQSLRDLYGDDAALTVTETGEFTWMTFGGVPSGQALPRLSFVQGAEFPGEEFMAAVSALEAGQACVTHNYPENIVYVVYMKGITASQEDLRELFLSEGVKNPVLLMARQDDMRTAANWFKHLEDQWGLKWDRPPVSFNQ